MKNIKNLIFDFGGVLYEIDVQRTIDAFKKLGLDTKPWQTGQDKIFDLMEVGKVSPTEILSYFKLKLDKNIPEQDILNAFNAILVELNHKSLSFLVKLKENYNIYLLSNTNEIHFRKFSQEILNNDKTKVFYDCFDKEYYSFKLGFRKPEIEIFEYVLNDEQLYPEETLFVDDTKENLVNPEKLGMHTFWMKTIEGWEKMIEQYNLKV